jgi:hypothetical protein
MGMGDPMGEPHPLEAVAGIGVGPKYPITQEMSDRIGSAFVYHKPTADQPARYTLIRNLAGDLARLICEQVPDSRERSIALTNIEQAVMWANAGIARNE